MIVFDRRLATLVAGKAGTTPPAGLLEASDEVGSTLGWSAADNEGFLHYLEYDQGEHRAPSKILGSQFLEE